MENNPLDNMEITIEMLEEELERSLLEEAQEQAKQVPPPSPPKKEAPHECLRKNCKKPNITVDGRCQAHQKDFERKRSLREARQAIRREARQSARHRGRQSTRQEARKTANREQLLDEDLLPKCIRTKCNRTAMMGCPRCQSHQNYVEKKKDKRRDAKKSLGLSGL